MKGTVSRKLRFLAAVTALASLLSFSNVYGEYYNDEKFEVYSNMSGNHEDGVYIVPNLYRQDTAYPYVKNFPLVVSNGVEYVPISMFSLYSYIDVTYSKVSDNFYMTNTKTNKYITFDVSQDLAETSDGETLDMETQICYLTRYIPAKEVARVMGVNCETYDDTTHGIYALRISDDNAKYTFNQQLSQYLPQDKIPESFNNSGSHGGQSESNEVPNEEKGGNVITFPYKPTSTAGNQGSSSEKYPDYTYVPSPENTPENNPSNVPGTDNKPESDPILTVANRKVAMMFEAGTAKDTANTIKAVTDFGITAAFSVSREYILSAPSDIRKIISGKHSLSVSLSEEEIAALTKENAKEQVLSYLEGANEALRTVSHRKTRLCTLPESIIQLFESESELEKLLTDNGYVLFNANVTADNTKSAFSVYTELSQGIVEAYPKNKAGLVKMIIPCSDKSRSIAANLAEFISKYPNFMAIGADETMA